MQKRAEGGGSTVARPDEKMGNTRDNPWWGTGKVKGRIITSAQRKVIKRIAAKKRRQRDKSLRS